MRLSNGLAALWAGVSLGGAIIAAPAKFDAPSLTLAVALDVGRAQFYWVAVGEAVLCACFLASLLFAGPVRWRLALLPVLLFAVQRLVVMPPLDARTVQIMTGAALEPSSLHLTFVVLECAKCLVLAVLGLGIIEMGRSRPLCVFAAPSHHAGR